MKPQRLYPLPKHTQRRLKPRLSGYEMDFAKALLAISAPRVTDDPQRSQTLKDFLSATLKPGTNYPAGQFNASPSINQMDVMNAALGAGRSNGARNPWIFRTHGSVDLSGKQEPPQEKDDPEQPA